MNSFMKKGIVQKIMVVLTILILFNFTIPMRAYAGDWSLGGALLKEVMQLVSSLGDIGIGLLNNTMLGADGIGSAMLSKSNSNFQNEDSWLYLDKDKPDTEYDKLFEDGKINANSFIDIGDRFKIPNMLYSPENIFANNIAALDVNFLRENEYQAISNKESANKKSESAAGKLSGTIASWYKSFRNIAIVGLLSVLIYLGIRILISSTAPDKAKYKELLKDWFVALCLIFVIHFIMSGILMITDKVTDLFGDSVNEGITVKAYDGNEAVAFKTNLVGLIRFQAQSDDWQDTTAYTIIYFVLVIYTFMFTFLYFKRFLYTAFFTMIAPLVALTYPIDRAGDGKSQAFNMWFKEYTMNVIIQPIHLILYTVFVSSAYDLAAENPIYAIVAVGFLIPAEKFIKKMFGLDKAETAGSFGSLAGGAMLMNGLNKIASKKKVESSNSGKSSTNGEEEKNNIFMPDGSKGKLGTFGNTASNSGDINSQGSRIPNNGTNNSTTQEQQEDPRFGSNNVANPLNSNTTGLNGGSSSQSRNGETTSTGKAMGKLAIKGVKKLGKGIWKNKRKIARGLARGVGTVAGATMGLSAAAASGDPSKALAYMGAGALAGNSIGKNAVNFTADTAVKAKDMIKDKSSGIKDEWNEAKYGREYAREKQIEANNKKAKKAFLKDEKEIAKYKEMAGDMGYEGNIKDLMTAAADYKIAGITDVKMIENALKVEHKRGGIGGNLHQNMVDVASYASRNDLGKKTFDDDKKFASFEKLVASTGLPENKQEEVKQLTAQLVDREKLYNKRKREQNR